ncbi:Bardet-Biedl syndrome 12-like protein [Elysia marginata]|uniref:Bardet-Biedl syndrome 12-like protein n=1 Tax=Elysia marginata TaxID=1093978 RepID=A0AAV4HBS6_9GAST|nr:Bardet-Biedl syndrome 12-like protein [Elysia marginata]
MHADQANPPVGEIHPYSLNEPSELSWVFFTHEWRMGEFKIDCSKQVFSIKCISDDDDVTYTTDILCLLSHIDIEHPVGEVILQALEAHKETNRTGSKTLLFMITRISKVVSQLNSLGIPVRKSLDIINTYILKLIQDVESISIPVTTCADKQMCEDFFLRNVRPRENERQLSSQTVCNDLNEKLKDFTDGKEIAINTSNICMLPNEKPSDYRNESHSPKRERSKTKLLNSGDNDLTSDLLETDPVFLKMTPAPQSVPDDDLLWYFNSSNNNGSKAAESEHDPNQSFQTDLQSFPEDADSNMQQLLQRKTDSLVASCTESPEDTDKHAYSPLCNIDKRKASSNKMPSQLSLQQHSKTKDKKDHDSDFEDCFDDDENRKHFSVTLETTPVNSSNLTKGHNQNLLLLHNAQKHFSSDTDFDFDSERSSNDCCDDESEDEFSYCFTGDDFKDENNLNKKSLGPLNSYGDSESGNVNGNFKLLQQSGNADRFSSDMNDSSEASPDSLSLVKIHNMIDSVANYNSLTLNSKEIRERSPIKGARTEDHGITTRVTVNSKSFALNNYQVKENSNSDDHKKQLHHIDLLNKILTEKQNGLKVRRSHEITISSRHLSDIEVDQTCANRLGEDPKVFSSPSPVAFENLCASKNLDRISASIRNSQETLKEEEETANSSLTDCYSHDTTADRHSDPTLDFPSCQSQKLELPQDTRLLANGELKKTIEHLLSHQMNNKQFTQFNLKLVNCLFTSGLAPLQSIDNEKCVSVVPGVVLPCDSHILQKLSSDSDIKVKKALLVKADLTPTHRHKGYKSTLENKLIVSTASDKDPGSESVWTSSILTTVQELKIDILLVKGKVTENLLDVLDSEGVLIVSNLCPQVLNTLAYVHNVDMVTYVTDATVEHVCDVELQPLHENWMDYLGDAKKHIKHFLKIVNSSEVQTVVMNYSNPASACIAEEELWKSLNCVANAIKDKKVLPGGGRTEVWCAEILKQKAISSLEANEGIQHAVLESLSQVFQNYSSVVQQNRSREQEQIVDDCFNVNKDTTPSSFKSQNTTTVVSNGTPTILPSWSSQDGLKFAFEDRHGLGDSVEEQKKVPCLENQTLTGFLNPQHSPNSDLNDICNFFVNKLNDGENANGNIYDNFASKVACWETAVDVVSLLANLNSLVITGIDMTSSDKDLAVF